MNEISKKNDRVDKSDAAFAVLEYFLSLKNPDKMGKDKSLRLFTEKMKIQITFLPEYKVNMNNTHIKYFFCKCH